MLKCDFNKVALQLYWNHSSAWVFSCKFAAFEHFFIRIPLEGCFWICNALVMIMELILLKPALSSLSQNVSVIKHWSMDKYSLKHLRQQQLIFEYLGF